MVSLQDEECWKRQVRGDGKENKHTHQGLNVKWKLPNELCVCVRVCFNSFSPKAVYIFPNILDLSTYFILYLTPNICMYICIKF